jgi:oligopeptide transport system permease protein
MLVFILKRLLIIIPMALLVVSVTWVLIRLAPGNFYSSEKSLPPAIEANIRKKYGLDKPWYQQYFLMLSNVVRGDFGDSLKYQGETVNDIIKRHLPYSATIGALAYLVALMVGISAGIIAALWQNSKFDYGSMATAMLGLSVPNFVLGPVLVLVFALGVYWLPPARWGFARGHCCRGTRFRNTRFGKYFYSSCTEPR